MTQKLWIPGEMPSLNKLLFSKVRATILLRQSWIEPVKLLAKSARLQPMDRVYMKYDHYRKTFRGDPSNFAAAAAKLIEDGLVQAGVLPDDSFKHITGFEHAFHIDKAKPGVLVTLVSQQ